MRLGIDLDGVVAAFHAGWMGLHNDEFGGSLTTDLVTMWDGLHQLGDFADMDAFWDWAMAKEHRPSMFRHLDLFPDAIDTLRALERDGHDIVIITTKPDWAIHDTMHWLADNAIPTREIHFSERKHDVACDVYLDDSPIVLPDLVANRPNALVCRFIRPWNGPVEGAIDVENWSDFHQLVIGRASEVSDING